MRSHTHKHVALFAFALVLSALAFLQVSSAQGSLGAVMKELILSEERSPVEQLRRPNMRWRVASRARGSVEWKDLGETHVSAPVGERVVTMHLAQRLAALQCEEWGRKAGGFRRGRCALQPSTTAESEEDIFFEYRLTSVRNKGDYAEKTVERSHVCKLYQESATDDNKVEVGTVTFSDEEEEEEEEDVGGSSVVFILQFHTTGQVGDVTSWLPAALRITGLSVDEVQLRRRRERASSSMAGRWGYPLLLVASLYAGLFILAKVANPKKSLAATPKQA